MSAFDSSTESAYLSDFLAFLNEACSAYHAVDASRTRLVKAGFVEIFESDKWSLERGGKYFFTRNDTSIVAFSVGKAYSGDSGVFTVLGAHTDSPCLKIKPVTCFKKADALMLNVQPYGGGLWHTWFDRDLGLAGRVLLKGEGASMETRLFRIDEPIARIPNLAIHLQTADERGKFAPNLQEHVKAILSMDPSFIDLIPEESEKEVAARIHPGLLRMVASRLGVDPGMIEDIEAQLIDVQPSCLGGACNELLYSGRLDNLCSTYQSLSALIDGGAVAGGEESNVKMVLLFDHEEVGSNSYNGAGSSMFMDTIRVINECLSDGSNGSLMRALRNSLVVSIDMAHAQHPNYASKHDSTMAPKINQGMVIKHHAMQRYATNAVSANLFRKIGKLAGVPVQEFTVRSDSPCGSTIGPIIATLSGILTVDCGAPQFSMHSIREMMGSKDVYSGYVHLKAVLEHHPKLTQGMKPATNSK